MRSTSVPAGAHPPPQEPDLLLFLPGGTRCGVGAAPSGTLSDVLTLRLCAALVAVVLAAPAAPADRGRRWSWPVPAPHLVVRPYVAPPTPYAAGHRGIDLTAPIGTPVTAPDDGIVRFAGRVADRGVLSIDHGRVVSSFEPVRPLVRAGDRVSRGEVVAVVAASSTHAPGVLHVGARVAGGYVSPLLFLGGLRRAVLVPLSLPP